MNVFERWLCRILKVPPEPHPPPGAEGSVRTFRASRYYYYYRLAGWGLKQLGAVLGILFILIFGLPFIPASLPLSVLPDALEEKVVELQDRFGGDDSPAATAATDDEEDADEESGRRLHLDGLLRYAELFGAGFLLLQMPITFLMVRLDYRMRWYILTDRSLRIREGIRRIREMTMTFANIQNLGIEQGPVQRLLGISDLKVRTAGGGSDDLSGHGNSDEEKFESTHIGYFRGVDDARDVRDEILRRLREFRSSGLGDPDDHPEQPAVSGPSPIVNAARSLLHEAQALRRRVETG